MDSDPSLAVADFDELGDPPGAPPEAAFAPPYGVQPLDIPVGIGPGLMEQGGGLLPGGLSMELDPPLAAPFAPPPPLPPPGSPGPLLPPALTTIDQSELSSQLGLSLGGGGPTLPPPAPDPTPDDRLSATPSPTPSLPEDEPDDFRRPLPPQKPPPAPPPPTPDPSRRPKPPKRPRRRRDPNEPQKPLSAYALFFRDTQAAIKGQNPSATFGEVSKIVASMWDSLGEEQKQVYKRKTEAAKKEYLKAMDAYRAIQSTSDPPESPRPRCVRVGCDRPPIESSEWDSEYCSSECVVRHCRDVFLAWLAARNANNNVVFVK